MLSKEEIQKLRRVRSAARALLLELEGIDLDPAPEQPRVRRDLKTGRKEAFATNYALGTWRKPSELKRTGSK